MQKFSAREKEAGDGHIPAFLLFQQVKTSFWLDGEGEHKIRVGTSGAKVGISGAKVGISGSKMAFN